MKEILHTIKKGRKISLRLFSTYLMLSASSLSYSFNDPTQPPDFKPKKVEEKNIRSSSEAPAKKSNNYYVRMITIAPSERSAIVNGKRVKKGDSIGNGKVIDILSNEVKIKTAGNIKSYFLFKKTQKMSITHKD